MRLNLPGSQDYDPSLPWVSKLQGNQTMLAPDFIIYIDDVRSSRNSWLESMHCVRWVASMLDWLGIQDTARKHRNPSKTPGPWACSIVHTDGGTITLSVSQERWDKVKKILAWVAEQMAQGDTVDFKMLERHGGFLVYIVRTYPMVNPYRKGIHLMLDSWRLWCSKDGWKMTLVEIRVLLAE